MYVLFTGTIFPAQEGPKYKCQMSQIISLGCIETSDLYSLLYKVSISFKIIKFLKKKVIIIIIYKNVIFFS